MDVSTADVLLAKAWTVVEFVDETACAKTRREIVVDASASSFETWLASVEGTCADDCKKTDPCATRRC